MERLGKRIAFLCTGDEIVNGEILDSNTPHFAQRLIENNFVPGTRLIVSDDQKEMELGIRYLLQDHAVLITTGGLGPTSDDRTRFALSDALEEPLEFDDASWERINSMLNRLNVEIPENNRQQCLFPASAEIFANDNGTASACCVTKGEQLIFMLPGPPNECRPIFDKYILPRLQQADLQQMIHRRSWILLGVSEGKIAKNLDPLVEGTDCDIGYRVNYPYLEVKLQSTNEDALEAMIPKLEAQIHDRLISRDKRIASTLFREYLQKTKLTFSILDEATQGRLATTLMWPDLYDHIIFSEKPSDIKVKIEGLKEYWRNTETNTSDMTISIELNGQTHSDTIKVPVRGKRTPMYAVELICHWLLNQKLSRATS